MPITPTQLEALSRSPLSGTEDSADSFPPSKSGGLQETNFSPMSATDFLDKADEDEAVEWVMEDYLPAGGLVLLAGKPKEGKSTLTYELAV